MQKYQRLAPEIITAIGNFHIIGFYLYHVILIGQSRFTATSGLIGNTVDYRFCMYCIKLKYWKKYKKMCLPDTTTEILHSTNFRWLHMAAYDHSYRHVYIGLWFIYNTCFYINT